MSKHFTLRRNYGFLFFTFLFMLFSNCKKGEPKKIEYENFKVSEKVIPDSISQKMSKKGLDNTLVCRQSMDIGFQNYPSIHYNYVTDAFLNKNDTLDIWLNNYNGYFGNGILLKIFNNNFKVISINPHVIKGIKFEKFDPIKQELTLNKSKFSKGDSVFGNVYFECVVDSMKFKKMSGYFKAKIK